MNRKDLENFTTQFDPGDVTWQIEETKKRNQVRILLECEGSFNLLKTWLALKMIVEKIEVHEETAMKLRTMKLE